MKWHRSRYLAAAGLAFIASATAGAQRPGGGCGMPGMMRDSAAMAFAQGSHALVMRHVGIRRTVTNLPDGVRTVTESDDASLAALIRDHVRVAVARVERGDDPGLPMQSATVRALFEHGDRIRTSMSESPDGIVVVQTSSDEEVVALLQQHAADVSDLVDRGMAAMKMHGRARGCR